MHGIWFLVKVVLLSCLSGGHLCDRLAVTQVAPRTVLKHQDPNRSYSTWVSYGPMLKRSVHQRAINVISGTDTEMSLKRATNTGYVDQGG